MSVDVTRELERALRDRPAIDAQPGDDCSLGLYAYVSQSCGPAERAAFERHLATCRECQADLQSYHATTDLRLEATSRAGAATAQARVKRYRLAVAWVLGGAIAAAACVLLVALLPGGVGSKRSADARRTLAGEAPGLRIKGPFELELLVQRQGRQPFVADPATPLMPGDQLGVFYTAAEPLQVHLYHVGRAGAITRMFATAPGTPLEPAARSPLPTGGRVDPGAGCEWLVAFTSRTPLSVEATGQALARAASRRADPCVLNPVSMPGAAVQRYLLRIGK